MSDRNHAPGNGASQPTLDLFDATQPLETSQLTLAQARNPPRERCLWGSMLPLGKPSVIFSPSGEGKSGLIAGLGFACAGGLPDYCGLPIHEGGGPVLVYDAEDTFDDWQRKFAAQLVDNPTFPIERALERLFVYEKVEGFARLVEEVAVHCGTETRREHRHTAEVDRIIATAKLHEVKLIAMETISRFVSDEDNANFSAVMSAGGRIARESGAALLFSHHVSKAAATKGDRSPEAARGGGSLIANARNALSLSRATPKEAQPFIGIFSPDQLSVLEHAKTTSSVKRQKPIILVRCETPYGGVFRRATIAREDSRVADAAVELFAQGQLRRQQGERLRALVSELVGQGEQPTERRLREFTTRLDIPKHEIPEAVHRAKADGWLRQGPTVRGGGRALLPGEVAQAARPDPLSSPLGQPELAQVVSPLGGPVPRASSEGEVARPARTGPVLIDVSRASSDAPLKEDA